MTYDVTLIPGDGIGPEITAQTVKVLEATGLRFSWDEELAGVSAVDATGTPLPDATVESIRKNTVALKGPLTTPVGTGFRSVNVGLRKEFELFANIRPAKSIVPGGRFESVDIVLVRENLEGLPADRLEFAEGDIADREAARAAVEGCDAVVNFAAESHVDRSIESPGEFITTDVFGTFVLLEASRDAGIRHLQVSTDEVYGDFEEGTAVETSPLQPSSPYAASKAGGDLLVSAFARTYGKWRAGQVSNVDAYVRQAIVNAVRGAWRRRLVERRHADALERQAVDDAYAPSFEGRMVERADVWDALRRLSPGQRRVVVLRYYEDLDVSEVARLLGVSVGTVKSQAAKGLAALQSMLRGPQ